MTDQIVIDPIYICPKCKQPKTPGSELCSKCRGISRRIVSPRDQEIFSLVTNIEHPMTYEAAGAKFGISKERVRQIIKKVADYTGKEESMKKRKMAAMLPPVSTTPEQRALLEQIAEDQGVSIAHLIRQAVSQYIKLQKTTDETLTTTTEA